MSSALKTEADETASRSHHWEELRQDTGYACRQLWRAPGFTAAVVITLGLAIGACTVVFTAINSTLLHPMAGSAATPRDVIVHETQLPRIPQMQLSAPMFRDLERMAKTFDTLAGWAARIVTLDAEGEPLQLRAAVITPSVIDIWGTRAELGRSFSQEEFARRERVAMLSHGLWQRAFGGAPSIIGRSVTIDGVPCTVVGIIAPEFARYGSDVELWLPLAFSDDPRAELRGAHYLQTMGRLKPGVSLAQAQAELDVIAANLARQYPDTNQGGGLLVRDFGAYINRSLAPMLYLLLGAVGCVLLIACANVANLLLARATVRQRELSIRAALGASRARLVRQLLVESMILAALGAGLGLLLAQWGLRFVRTYGPTAGTDLARLAYIELDPAVAGFTAVIALLTGIVFGLAPAWLSTGVSVNDVLKQGGRGTSEGSSAGRLRRALVVVEVAVALVLLAAAGLLVRSFARLAETDPGFVADKVAALEINLNGRKYAGNSARVQFADQLLGRIRALPGVEAVGLGSPGPLVARGNYPFNIVGQPLAATQPAAVPALVTADYFRALKIKLRRGREFDERDGVSGPPVFIVNEALAKVYFGTGDAVGQRLSLSIGRDMTLAGEIVGVVADAMQGTVGEPAPPTFYAPWATLTSGTLQVWVRTAGDPAAALTMLKQQVYALDRNQPVLIARTVASMIEDKLARSHFMLVLLGVYGAIALVIATVGIYAVMAYSVTQRMMEFGIRMALGASRAHVIWHVLRQGLLLIAIGLASGLAAALAFGRVVESLLYRISPRDPVTLIVIAALLLLVSVVACWVPARRATKVDPLIALRSE